jgi:hypothetical protein
VPKLDDWWITDKFARMKLALFLFCLLTHAADVLPSWAPEVRSQSTQMKERVDSWLSGGETVPAEPLRVVYLYCSDQVPFPKHHERINRVLTEIQDWYRSQHEAAGFGAVTFALERDVDGRVKLHEGQLPVTVKSRYQANKRGTHKACVSAARSLLQAAKIDYDRSFVLVLTTIPDDHSAAPFFGNIMPDRGYCFAVDTPWLDSVYDKIDGPKVWKGQPVGPANSALIGGICHELGHGFGLTHCDEHAQQRGFGESLMARGNYAWRQEQRGPDKGTFLLNSDAAFLFARPPFASATRDFHRRPEARVEYLQLVQHGQVISMTGSVRSDIPVYALRVFDDPPGNGDYDAVSWVTVPNAESGEFALDISPRRTPGQHDLKLMLYHVNGRWTRLASKMPVARSGRVDLNPVRRKLYRLPTPSEVTADSCALAAAKAESVKVGWGWLHVGRTPEGPLRLGGKTYSDGLFAHSPSRIVYRLGSRWKTLSVTAGLQDNTAKQATFRVLGDGRDLAECQNLVGARTLTVDVIDVDKLELITLPSSTGNRSSWTIWASPTLRR